MSLVAMNRTYLREMAAETFVAPGERCEKCGRKRGSKACKRAHAKGRA